MTTSLVHAAPSAGSQLAWCQPQSASEAWTLAETIAKSRLAPKGYDTVEQIFIAMQHGAELGLNAMQALQGIAMVNGRPAVWGTTLWALVQRSRLVQRWMKGALALTTVDKIVSGVWKGKTDANAALIDALVVRLADRMDDLKSRKVAPPNDYLCGYAVFQLEDDIHVQIFDSAHAQKASLLGKQGPWTQYPERMHQHRAVTFLARDACGSALTGIAGAPTAEEVYDMEGTIETTAQDVVRRADPEAKAAEMATAQAGAPAPAPSAPQADRKVEVNARLRSALDRLKTIEGIDGKALVKDKVRELFGSDLAMTALTVDQRDTLAAAIEQVEAPAPADDAGEQAPSFDDADPDSKLNF